MPTTSTRPVPDVAATVAPGAPAASGAPGPARVTVVTPRAAHPRQADLARRLAALERAGAVTAHPEPRFDRVVRMARQIFDVPTVHVWLAGEAAGAQPGAGASPAWRFRAEQPLLDPEGGLLGTLVIADTRPRDLTADQDALLRDLARWVSKEIAVDAELDHAQRVQLGLLPRDVPQVDGYQVAGACLPGGTIGGDFYDWYPVDGGVVLTLADVMGEGPAAAILAAAARIALRASADGVPVDRALALAGVTMHADLTRAGLLATAFHARLDAAGGEVTYADAGHGLTLVVRTDGRAERLDALGLPLGVSEDARREAAVVHLGPGDLLLAVSDGALALVDGTIGGLGLGLLAAQVAGCATADEAVQRVLRLAAAVAGPVEDLTVVALRREVR